jgi:RNA polymerase sigma-70 factor (ECF subfamily)
VNPEPSEIEQKLIEGTKKGERHCQEKLYKHFYGYGMSICLRYAPSREEASEILNDSFLKVFKKIEQYDLQKSFRGWLRRIIINTAIDYFRRNEKHYHHLEVEKAATSEEAAADAISSLTAEEIYALVQKLPDIYRLTFNLYEIEGFSHEEIGQQLGIPAGTSRSNLSRAKQKLRALIAQHFGSKHQAFFK